jgi:hypothetical protein
VKALVAFAVLIVVLFVVGLGLGGRDSEGPVAPDRQAFVNRIRSIASSRHLRASDVTGETPAGCFVRNEGRFALQPGGECNVPVPRSVRKVVLRPTAGNVTATIRPADPTTMLEQTEGPDGGVIELDTFGEQESLIVSCAAKPCRASLD